MTRNPHDEARELIALGDDLAEAQLAWLQHHLAQCAACRDYAEEAAGRVLRALPSLPVAADARLVRAPHGCGCAFTPAGCGRHGNACGWWEWLVWAWALPRP